MNYHETVGVKANYTTMERTVVYICLLLLVIYTQ